MVKIHEILIIYPIPVFKVNLFYFIPVPYIFFI